MEIYLLFRQKKLRKKKLYSGSIKSIFVKNKKENIDIDNQKDFILAKKMI